MASEAAVIASAAATRMARFARTTSISAPAGVCATIPAIPRRREREADRGLVPVLNRQQVDREIGAEAVADIGEEEVQRVERPASR
jgi:hypothetical protein